MIEVLALRPFVPSKDYALSKRFYDALGFEREFENDEVTAFREGAFSFFVQNFWLKALAHNFMLQLLLDDVEAWWRERVDAERLTAEFGVQPPQAPAVQPWGLKVGFLFDPAGVLWHVAEVSR